MSEKRKVEIHVEYYKVSGKFYTDTKFTKEFTCIFNEDGSISTVYMPEVSEYIKDLREHQCLPGLTGGPWSGPIRITTEKGYPCLIMPERKKSFLLMYQDGTTTRKNFYTEEAALEYIKENPQYKAMWWGGRRIYTQSR